MNIILGGIDVFSIALAFQFAYMLNNFEGGFFFFSNNFVLTHFLILLPIWILLLYLLKVAEIPRTKRYRVLFFEYLQSAIVLFLIFTFVYFAFNLYPIPRLFIIEVILSGLFLLFSVRLFEYKVFKIYRSKGYNTINVVLIADDTSEQIIKKLIERKEWGYKIFTIFTESQALQEKYEKTIILLPGKYMKVLNDLMDGDLVDEVLYIKNKVVPSEVREIISSCEEVGVTFKLRIKEPMIKLTNAFKSELANEVFLTFTNIPHNPYQLAIKKVMDVLLSLILIIVLSPVFILIALLIRITSKGPVIFRQARVGLRGRPFDLYKFRTMVENAEDMKKELHGLNEVDGPVFKIKDDPRVTAVGKILRRTGLDEFPQLFNVLKGEMSLIGPRPPLQSETLLYKRWQLRRLSVKPGLSCFWQIKPERNSIKFDKWMELDLAYIDNWSIRLDLLILLKTVGTVFKRTGL
ncbi:MAG TPA: exopolysaccharide biosynthesis polyprenyl glycosylphosphotransferase [Bacteroidales bacterium]|nr:exopolysaccharide biosynthesis polyprenyl glycosylphosphotransferase [Bacteroidales bacterium]